MVIQGEVDKMCILRVRFMKWIGIQKRRYLPSDRLESSHDDRKRVVDIDFYALTDAVKFWHHCHEEHSAYWRPDLQSVLYGPQGLVRLHWKLLS